MKTPDFYVKLVISATLSKQQIKSWLECCSELLPAGLMTSIQVNRIGFGKDNMRLIHRTLSNGDHEYIIPLTRHLTSEEFYKITSSISTANMDFEIKASDFGLTHVNQISKVDELLTDEQKDIFSKTLAKNQHNRWAKMREKDGWRFGTLFDNKNKISPLVNDWDNIPEPSKNIDSELLKDCVSLLDSFGFTIIQNDLLTKLLVNHKPFKSSKDIQ